uniref:Uncharacterized protein n=1 Tax=Rhizophora mucronata TaxID=61149 RepID=A0A2P2LTN1_RHIMU
MTTPNQGSLLIGRLQVSTHIPKNSYTTSLRTCIRLPCITCIGRARRLQYD